MSYSKLSHLFPDSHNRHTIITTDIEEAQAEKDAYTKKHEAKPRPFYWEELDETIFSFMIVFSWIMLPFIISFMWGQNKHPAVTGVEWLVISILIACIPIVRYLLWIPFVVISLYFVYTDPVVANNIAMFRGAYEYATLPDWQVIYNIALIPIAVIGMVFGMSGHGKFVGGAALTSIGYNMMK